MRATEATEVEPALREIIAGRLDPSRPGGYGWLLELLGRVHGTPLGSVVLPGRGWHQLEDVFRACGLTELSELWGRAWPFPWRTDLSDAGPWPFPMLVPHADLHRVQAELSGFETELLDAHHDLLPGGDDDVEDVSWLIEKNLPVWVEAALTEGRDLLLLRDGGR
ncbi:hypothetical protein [Streptomyces sp. NPDC000983]|uniref:hypothetical protein n=1 Tax=Streptomyces sp. NPDC000983 TaxID=3154373 RepID=UPI00331C3A1E